MDLIKFRRTGSGRSHRSLHQWLAAEGFSTERPVAFEMNPDLSQLQLKESSKIIDVFNQFIPFFEAGLCLESLRDEGSDLLNQAKILSAFVNGKTIEGEKIDFPIINIKLPDRRLLVQRARTTGGLLEVLGLDHLKKWQDPHLLFVPFFKDIMLLFVTDQSDPVPRQAADQAWKALSDLVSKCKVFEIS